MKRRESIPVPNPYSRSRSKQRVAGREYWLPRAELLAYVPLASPSSSGLVPGSQPRDKRRAAVRRPPPAATGDWIAEPNAFPGRQLGMQWEHVSSSWYPAERSSRERKKVCSGGQLATFPLYHLTFSPITE